jgi:PAS domain S-box-containing protein
MELYYVVAGVTAATCCITLGIGSLALRQRPEPGATWLGASMVASTVWQLAIGFGLGAGSLSERLLWTELGWIGIAALPVAWLLFTLDYTGRGHVVSKRAVVGGFSLAAVAVAVVWANPRGLVRHDVSYEMYLGVSYLDQTYGPLFWLVIACLNLVGFVGTTLLLKLALESESLYRGQATAMTAAALFPHAGSFAYLFGVTPHPALNPIPFSFTVSGLLLVLAISQYQFLDRIPIPRRVARNLVVERMDDGVVVVDRRGEIVDVNDRALELLAREERPIGRSAAQFVPGYDDAVGEEGSANPTNIVTSTGTPRRIEVRETSVRDVHDRVTGRIVVLRDVTEQRTREQRLDVLNRVLRHNLRNEINVVYGYADHLAGDPDEDAAKVIKEKSSTIVELADKAREIERVLDAAKTDGEPIEIIPALNYVLADVERRADGATLDLTVQTTDDAHCHSVVEAVVENLVEDLIQYAESDAPRIELAVAAEDDQIRIDVAADVTIPEAELRAVRDGSETQLEHASGLRLWLVVWGVRQVGGSITFDPDDDTVVSIRVDRRDPPNGRITTGPVDGESTAK